jgi:cell division septal protein FtsQ
MSDPETIIAEKIAAQLAAGAGNITIRFGAGGVKKALATLINEVKKMSNEIDNLRAEVARNTDVTASAIALVQGLKAQLDAAIASGDMSQVQALADSLGQNDTALATAVTESGGEPQPAPAPAPEPAPQRHR